MQPDVTSQIRVQTEHELFEQMHFFDDPFSSCTTNTLGTTLGKWLDPSLLAATLGKRAGGKRIGKRVGLLPSRLASR